MIPQNSLNTNVQRELMKSKRMEALEKDKKLKDSKEIVETSKMLIEK